ncbi:lysine N(6)-hydroxylase/L-ornithine N(5)-oxygenase family protein [Streptomyces sp. G45]|uniref:lysine N(6)-hydroxylase/L-ornithine N(5)-oxygenase family protein n=1 Tax=Streptomyces sp. G45 TaxID=3406627 RepID=UPI003C272E43
MTPPDDTTPPEAAAADLVGIGFGPSNAALAIAFEETAPHTAGEPRSRMAFFERQPAFGWHRGMLIEGATMQVSFLKDLATMRNPMSRYTFMQYLKTKDRVAEFINSKTLFPLRVEFHDYLDWVARQFDPVVTYGAEVVALRPVTVDGVVAHLDVEARVTGDDGEHTVVRRARNVAVGTGLTPRMPDGIQESRRVWHSSRLMDRAATIGDAPRRLVVIGAGQSAAEATDYLHRTFPTAEVHSVFSRYGYSVADDSPFVNGIFDPKAVGAFYGAAPEVKRQLLGYHENTNYSVVDLELAESLYRTSYQERVLGQQRLWIRNMSRVVAAAEHADGVRVTVKELATGTSEVIEADAVVCATGYAPSDPLPLLQDVVGECKRDDEGRLVLGRDYRVATSDAVRCGIYVHGAGSEHSHGLAAGLLSNTAVRSGEIVDSILSVLAR